MRIGVISDSHYTTGQALPPLQEMFQGVAAILHAGDVGDNAFLTALQQIAPTYHVAGNCDRIPLAFAWPRQQVVELGGYRIGLVHGDGPGNVSTPKRAYQIFQNQQVQAIVFGHSHDPLCQTMDDGVLLFNPGSISRPLGKVPQKSYGILTLGEAGISGEIIYLSNSNA